MKKNRMKRLLATAVLLSGLSLTTAWAQQTMLVYSIDGSELAKYSLTGSTRITFGEDKMTVKETDQKSASFSLGQVRCIKFEDPTAIQGVTTNNSRLTARLKGDLLFVEGLAGETADARIVGLNGAMAMRLDHFNGQPINVGSLPHGIYILRIKNLSFKFVK
ncbi:MAG: T9SS type A sorting domain-containing protein [Prevotella sp.]|nr:T9SS type A sorting domain-containing protein [Bacteroidales bacterium]MDY4228997.1 T9SS type A sorting domain-containing protein [Prevotella sp.]MCI6102266.1 T9SS type A sorting domain-containing protein [Bacteroidales bacterium]MCI7598419.1 T9SS type A sorting domain-containing protein [Bacteroidales bacterium]MCI7654706.1 T9SS type A sorting domain-containing protein [Bacteroidales bacterium]